MKKSCFLCLTLMTLFFASCGSTEQVAATVAETVQNSNTGDSSIVFILLDSNPSTGYSWSCSVEDSTVAELVSNEYVPNSTDGSTVGSGGKHGFILKGKKEGKTKVTFSYARQGSSPSQKRVYEINVAQDKSSGLTLVSLE